MSLGGWRAPHRGGLRCFFAALALALAPACDDAEEAGDAEALQALVEGPFVDGASVSELGTRDEAEFRWRHAGAGKAPLRAELVAQAAPPLTLGATIHELTRRPDSTRTVGSIRLHPRDFQGSARRGDGGRWHWLPGVYRLRLTLTGVGEVGEIVFDVAR